MSDFDSLYFLSREIEVALHVGRILRLLTRLGIAECRYSSFSNELIIFNTRISWKQHFAFLPNHFVSTLLPYIPSIISVYSFAFTSFIMWPPIIHSLQSSLTLTLFKSTKI